MRYVIYARKSTEDDDRQVLSIEAQLVELSEFAAKEKLEIVASFQEAKTAKEPEEKHRREPYFAKPPIRFCPQNSIRNGRRAKRGGFEMAAERSEAASSSLRFSKVSPRRESNPH
ncbi:MAG: recombinase family protein [Candidatus Liptonbacteria bacterium]|nr:recombinase family protein [Candidatus Liptonbacteria bacterium]